MYPHHTGCDAWIFCAQLHGRKSIDGNHNSPVSSTFFCHKFSFVAFCCRCSSMTVFLMVVAESMPPTKSQIPLLALYFGFTIIVVTCTTFLTVFTLNIHYLGRRTIRMPLFVRCIVFGIIAKLTLYIVHLPNSGKLNQYMSRKKRKESITSEDISEVTIFFHRIVTFDNFPCLNFSVVL